MNWIIILLIIIYAVIYYYKKLKLQYKSKCLDLNFWKNKYGEHQKKLLNFIQQIQKYLEKHNIKYWAHAGTLLGQVRHNGFIPWDDDVDFGYLNELDIISNMLDELKSNGYIITKEFCDELFELKPKVKVKKIKLNPAIGIVNGLYANNTSLGGITCIQAIKFPSEKLMELNF